LRDYKIEIWTIQPLVQLSALDNTEVTSLL